MVVLVLLLFLLFFKFLLFVCWCMLLFCVKKLIGCCFVVMWMVCFLFLFLLFSCRLICMFDNCVGLYNLCLLVGRGVVGVCFLNVVIFVWMVVCICLCIVCYVFIIVGGFMLYWLSFMVLVMLLFLWWIWLRMIDVRKINSVMMVK